MSEANSMLSDVRRALGRSQTIAPPPLAAFLEPAPGSTDVVSRFIEELRAVRGHVHQLATDSPMPLIADVITSVCRETSTTKVAISGSDWLRDFNLVEALTRGSLEVLIADDGKTHVQIVAALAQFHVGVTTAEFAIAETGTIVLSSEEANSLLVSLLPPIHVAIVPANRICGSLDEGIQRLAARPAAPGQSFSFITGPSRTSDVELTLSIGVHGPKELHVIII